MKGFIPNLKPSIEVSTSELNNSFIELGVSNSDCEDCDCKNEECKKKDK